ncbi:MAG: ABC transporter ATP-binding protein [Chloroflexia bacterium]|nr:ABC transporter ATP-binding protein [Chloroflexia bacterium]
MQRLNKLMRRFVPESEGDAGVAAAPLNSLRDTVRRFWPDARPYRRLIALSLVLISVGPLLETATIALYGRLIDDVLVPGDIGLLLPIALTYLGLTVGGGVLSFARDYLSAWVGERFLLDMRNRVFRHVQSLPLEFFERQRLGDILTRLTDDVSEIGQLLVSDATSAISYLLKIVFFSAALFIIDWRLALISFIVAPPFWIAARRFSRRIKQISREQRQWDGAITAVAEESLANAALVQAYNRQDQDFARFNREARGDFAAQLSLERLRAIFSPIVGILELGGVLVVVAAGTWELSQGRLTLGGLLAFLAFLSQLYSPIRGLTSLVNEVFAATAGADRIIELLDQQPAVSVAPDARVLESVRGQVTVEGVGYRYTEARSNALTDVSFTIEPGETLAIVGQSGAGKSTLLKLLLRFADPGAGRILLDGHDLRSLDLESMRDQMAVVLQETLILDDTIWNNIAFGRPNATDAEVIAAAKAADAHDFILSLSERYQTRAGQRGRALSGGQRQRVAIARAMIRDAPILILDEPTTGLDAESSERILAPIRRLISGRTTIIVSHNLLTVREATRIVVLDLGRVVESGTHADLLSRDGTYAALYRLHQLTPPPVELTERLAATEVVPV